MGERAREERLLMTIVTPETNSSAEIKFLFHSWVLDKNYNIQTDN